MSNEDKELLLKELSARLPYGIICSCIDNGFTPPKTMNYELASVNLQDKTVIVNNEWNEKFEFHIENIKPYLRPMSSMTNKERKEFECCIRDPHFNTDDWFYANHFDHRGLILRGLGIDYIGKYL